MALSIEQQEFVNAEGKVVLCACPGSGKTFTLAHKLSSYLDIWTDKHKGIAVLSFTNIASKEIEKKTKELTGTPLGTRYPHFVGTIDSFLNQFIFLRYAYLLTKQNIKPHLSQVNIEFPFRYWRKECHRKGCTKTIQDFRWSIDDQTYKNGELVTCSETRYGLPCDQYKNMLIQKGIFFQNDVSYIVHEILVEYPQIAKAIAERFPVILLDEAQDTSKEQMAIFDLLSNAGIKTICLVGDPDQSIYEWRNASASGFIEKMENQDWNTLYLTENRRSSQMICNATKAFSTILENKRATLSVGEDKDFLQKPELILVDDNVSKEATQTYFLNRCTELGIEHTKDNISILTRGKIHNDIDIKGLWKSQEIELLAKASYYWQYQSKRDAHNLCSKCLYLMFIGNLYEQKHDFIHEVENKISYDIWTKNCLDLLINLPSADLEIGKWVDDIKNIFQKINIPLGFLSGKTLDDVLKIKRNDKATPNFKSIPLRCFFEKKSEENITISSIHGVKGETFEATLLYAPSIKGATITKSMLTTGNLENENNRAAYVAMTRPRKYLAIALKKPTKKSEIPLKRFPTEVWDYIEF